MDPSLGARTLKRDCKINLRGREMITRQENIFSATQNYVIFLEFSPIFCVFLACYQMTKPLQAYKTLLKKRQKRALVKMVKNGRDMQPVMNRGCK